MNTKHFHKGLAIDTIMFKAIADYYYTLNKCALLIFLQSALSCWHGQESRHRSLWPLQVTITMTKSALLIFFAIWGWKIAGMGGQGLNRQS